MLEYAWFDITFNIQVNNKSFQLNLIFHVKLIHIKNTHFFCKTRIDLCHVVYNKIAGRGSKLAWLQNVLLFLTHTTSWQYINDSFIIFYWLAKIVWYFEVIWNNCKLLELLNNSLSSRSVLKSDQFWLRRKSWKSSTPPRIHLTIPNI